MTTFPTLAEQLRFPKRPRIFPVTQVIAEIVGDDKETALNEARNQVLRWMRNRIGFLPFPAWKHGDFELNESGIHAEAVRIRTDDVDYWTAKLTHLDHNFPRNWTTELAVGRHGLLASFGARLVVSTMESDPEFSPSVPGIVLQMAESPGLSKNGHPLMAQPWIILNDDDVANLVDLIENSRRREPVFVVSLDERERDPKTALIDTYNLAKACIGIAYVVVLPGPESFLLSDRVGKEFSVFHRAVRIYKPGCNFIDDNPYSHPLTLPERINSWRDSGPQEFAAFLRRYAAKESIVQSDPDRDLPSFAKVKQASLARRREGAQQHGDRSQEMLLLAQENESLRESSETALSLALGEEQARRAAETRVTELESSNAWLRQRISQLEQNVKTVSGDSVDARITTPDSLSELKSWSQEHLAGRAVVTGKALRAAKDSEFDDVSYAYNAVLLMANQYRDMRMEGGQEAQQKFEDALREMELENSRTGDETRLREQGDEFFVEFNGSKRLLEWHLKKAGNTRDPRRCFRLYYFWDDETQQVVIGSMPGHLATRAS